MSHCPDCGDEIENLAKGNATARHTFSAATVWECPHCGVILGVSDNG
ncbi:MULTISPECIES: phage terminase large subunit family protein [unclassified Haladaptatus]|nr:MULTISPECIES: phage terminase large subunit family protein [unclassified Haladaptatus]MCO8242892.1 phage terminase large subunit family protein [Haladaptatus sp. AB643]MCO8252649.1 phage terminase large subunit family protein [Haladaptatus sp. AB618]